MNSKFDVVMVALPLGLFSLLAKPAVAAENGYYPNAQTTIVAVQPAPPPHWRSQPVPPPLSRQYGLPGRQAQNRPVERRVWVAGHYEPGFLGIGRRWVAGRWEVRR
jgi:hypothetical protein